MNESSDIDFVVTWVDGADPAWLESRRRFRPEGVGDGDKGAGGANAACRYRDFGTLRHWFRAAENAKGLERYLKDCALRDEGERSAADGV